MTLTPTTAADQLDRLLDQLDVEDDDDIRADLIEGVFQLLDRYPNDTALRNNAAGYSIRFAV